MKSKIILFCSFICLSYTFSAKGFADEHKYTYSYIKCLSGNNVGGIDQDWAIVKKKSGDYKYFKLGGYWDNNTFVTNILTADELKEICKETIEYYRGNTNTFFKFHAQNYSVANMYPIKFKEDFVFDTDIKRIVVFGDSLSDTGNVFKYTLGFIPAYPYWGGRFSNGPVWVDHLSNMLNLPMDNWAYGNAKSSPNETFEFGNYLQGYKIITSPMTTAIGNYLSIKGWYSSTESWKEKHSNIYILWIGGNNYLEEKEFKESTVLKVISDLQVSLEKLYQAGGRYFLIPDLPDLSTVPRAISEEDVNSNVLKKLSLLHNKLIKKMITQFKNEKGDAVVVPLRMLDHFSRMQSQPEVFGYKNLSEACYFGKYSGLNENDKICQDPENHMYFDSVHPSSKTHCWLSWFAQRNLYKAKLISKPSPFELQSQLCGTHY